MELEQVKQLVTAGIPDAQIITMGATPEQIATAKNPVTTQTAVYKHYGNTDSGRFGRSRNVKNGEQFTLTGTKEDTFNNNAFTRWVFKRADGSEWTPSESSIGMWVREFYPEFVGKAEAFFNHLVSLGTLTVSQTKMAENDFGNSVQCVKF